MLARRGVREINVIGQEISSYGRDLGEGADLPALLQAIDGCGADWIRLLYSHPPLVDRRFAETMAGCAHVVPYLDFPVEHVSGHVLRKMARKGDATSIAQTMQMLRDTVPGLTLRTSIIVGFPGERERDFEELLAFVREHPFDRLGAFVWSPEEGTPSVRYDGQVPRELAEERRDRLMEAQMEISLAANEALVGSRDRVLVDEVDEAAGSSVARSVRDALDIDNSVEIAGLHRPGTFVDVRYVDAMAYDLFAEALGGGEAS